MKTLEMFKKLAENPSHKYEAIDSQDFRNVIFIRNGYFNFERFDRKGKLVDSSLGGGGFNGNIKADYEWELVREPVDFMTAINSGKRIRSEFWDENVTVPMMAKGICLQVNRLEINGRWYMD